MTAASGSADRIVDRDFAAWEAALRRARADFFSPGAPAWVARAPGRLDVMGGIADYSGSLVAEMPIAQAAVVGAQRDDAAGGTVLVRSADAAANDLTPEVVLPPELFVNPVSLLKHLRDGPEGERWAGYVAGCLALLRAEGLAPRGAGARLFVASGVPLGAGVSSSAAVEVASMRALCAAFGVEMDGLTLARLCQRVENDVMDAPCGVMDQVTSALGEAGRLLVLRCQPYLLQGTVALPPGWSVFGIDSGVKHSVGGSNYTRARVATFMGYKILADKAGSGFGGYLCNVSPDEYRALAPGGLPETLSGAVFLGAHGGIFDTVTAVDPSETYPVRACAEHAIFENARVERFLDLSRRGDDESVRGAGGLMRAAHDSYTACGLGAAETDRLVEIAVERGGPSVAGAKITGGGSGGTVAVLCRADDEERVAETIADAYAAETGRTPLVIRGSSPGACATLVREVVP
jgi:L-arabinokinase